MPDSGVHRVVEVGGGFGGLQAVQKLRRAPVEVTLIDRRNFHLFQPLTYQVATGALSAGEIALSAAAIFTRKKNVQVLLAEVSGFDLAERRLYLSSVDGEAGTDTVRTTCWSWPAVRSTRTSVTTNGRHMRPR